MTRLALVLALSLAACVGEETDDRPVSFKYIVSTITTPSCATSSCHSSLAQTAGLELDDADDAYERLLDPDDPLVVAGDPDESELVEWIEGGEELFMPPDMPLSDADVGLIRRWIADGARNN